MRNVYGYLHIGDAGKHYQYYECCYMDVRRL